VKKDSSKWYEETCKATYQQGYGEQDVTHYDYFVTSVYTTAVGMLLTFKANMQLHKLLPNNSAISFTRFAYFPPCIVSIL
jgi:hypothetical protein